MKTTIRGVRYDSDRAILVGKHVHGKVEADPSWWSASLCRQPTSGRYFLAGTGGNMTVFRGDARIIPLTVNEGLAWADRYLGGKY